VSRRSAIVRFIAAACIAAAASLADVTAAPSEPAPAELRDDIKAVLEAPEFETETTVQRWQWRGERVEPEDGDDDAAGRALLRRLAAIADWVAQAMEALLWGLALVTLILIYLRRDRWLHLFARQAPVTPYRTQHQVSGLDIRPEQLPADIVAAARSAWESGDAVAALSLLYRAALSRLVHERQLVLPDSATEGECVRLVGRSCGGALAEYFGVLTRSWQFVAYAGRPPSAESADWLLDNFDRHFGPAGAQ
jgi:hypothetical protein